MLHSLQRIFPPDFTEEEILEVVDVHVGRTRQRIEDLVNLKRRSEGKVPFPNTFMGRFFGIRRPPGDMSLSSLSAIGKATYRPRDKSRTLESESGREAGKVEVVDGVTSYFWLNQNYERDKELIAKTTRKEVVPYTLDQVDWFDEAIK